MCESLDAISHGSGEAHEPPQRKAQVDAVEATLTHAVQADLRGACGHLARRQSKKGLLSRSAATLVAGPCPGYRIVCSGSARTSEATARR